MKIRYALLAGILAGAGFIEPSLAQTPAAEEHILNLTDVEIQTLIDDVSTITGYTFVVNPEVRANVTVTSQVPMSTQEVFQVFLSTLRVNGYAAVPLGRGFYSIEPAAVAALSAGTRDRGDNIFVTEVFHLDHFSAVEAAKMIQPLMGAEGQVSASPGSNALIVVGYGSNLPRVRSVLDRIDEDRSVTKTIALKTIPATEMQAILTGVQGGSDGNARGRTGFSATASEASNAIVLRGDSAYVERSEELIRSLDVKSQLRRETRVVRLNHIEGATILPILNEISGGVVSEQSGAPATSSASASITLYEPSNAIILSATPETIAAIMHVISELDVRRKQVLVEAIIVNVSDTAAHELGLQFFVSGENGLASSTFPAGTPGLSTPAPNLLALTGALADGDTTEAFGGSEIFQQAATSALLGLTGGTVGFGGQNNGTLFSVILNALQTDSESNILSTPSIVALNNEEALVSVGQEIPISSGQVLGDANSNPFQTTERREIGVILSVTPRIGDDNTIRLDIDQEVSSIDDTIGTVTTDFILNQSQFQTKVIANDGQLIVLGGLITAQDTIDVAKVPLLGDIPGVGRLFQNKETARSTGNLMVFIRPTIIEDAADAKAATDRSYNYIRAQQILANEGGPSSLDQFVGEVLNGDLPEIETDEEAQQ